MTSTAAAAAAAAVAAAAEAAAAASALRTQRRTANFGTFQAFQVWEHYIRKQESTYSPDVPTEEQVEGNNTFVFRVRGLPFFVEETSTFLISLTISIVLVLIGSAHFTARNQQSLTTT